MAASVRQACFKCGNLGHISANCASPPLCYNCKEPGHQASACPSPASTDAKQCYLCSGIGHISVDCPQAGSAPRVPVVFGPARGGAAPAARGAVAGGRGGGAGRGARGKCFTCGGVGHIAAQCPGVAPQFRPAVRKPVLPPNGAPVVCRRCNGSNHYARDCLAPPAPRGETEKVCYVCKTKGHIAKACPNADKVEGEGAVAAVVTQ